MKRTSVWYYIHITARERADGARPFSAACSLCRNGWMGAGGWASGERRAGHLTWHQICLFGCALTAFLLPPLFFCVSPRWEDDFRSHAQMCMPNASNETEHSSHIYARLLLISLVVLLLDRVLYDGLDPCGFFCWIYVAKIQFGGMI